MKLLSFGLFLIFICSCGMKTSGLESNFLLSQEAFPFIPQSLSVDETNRIKSICDALSFKENQLSVLEATQYIYSYSEKACTSAGLSSAVDTGVYIQNAQFRVISTNAPFIFPNIETKNIGVMKEICESLSNLTSPMLSASSGAMWFTSFTQGSDCVYDSTHTCIQIERGTSLDGVIYKKTSKEVIRFKTSGDKVGFFTERKLISNISCSDGNTLVRQAVLK